MNNTSLRTGLPNDNLPCSEPNGVKTISLLRGCRCFRLPGKDNSACRRMAQPPGAPPRRGAGPGRQLPAPPAADAGQVRRGPHVAALQRQLAADDPRHRLAGCGGPVWRGDAAGSSLSQRAANGECNSLARGPLCQATSFAG